MKPKTVNTGALICALSTTLLACTDTTTGTPPRFQIPILGSSPPSTSSPSTTTPPAPLPAPTSSPRSYHTDALIFNGDGTWQEEVSTLVGILRRQGASYQVVNSSQLDALTFEDITKFGVLIFPGGTGSTQAGSLEFATRAALRAAIQEGGVNYIGFCAGAFIAVAPPPLPGKDVSYGLGIVPGPELEYYYLEYQSESGVEMTAEKFADGTVRDLVWYGGPVTPNTPGGVVAKYPNGEPAITQIWSGKGFVVLSGVHPAAPQSIRDYYDLDDQDGLDFDLTWTLISAALHQKPLPAF